MLSILVKKLKPLKAPVYFAGAKTKKRTMKTLIILAHPDIENSRINKTLKNAALEEQISISALYEKYPNFTIDIKKEQELLVNHDKIVF